MTAPKSNNGWTKDLEILFTEWADRASCFHWMHDKTTRKFQRNDQSLMFPVIILSTVTGAANFAINSITDDQTIKNYIQLGLGTLSIFTGILTTIANRLAYSAAAETHQMASVAWGKFNTLLCVELSLDQSERMDAFAFIKVFRVELNRLIEQSPTIPEPIIRQFTHEFKDKTNLKKPLITGDLDYTHVFKSSINQTESILNEFTKVTTLVTKVSEPPLRNSNIYSEPLSETVVDVMNVIPSNLN